MYKSVNDDGVEYTASSVLSTEANYTLIILLMLMLQILGLLLVNELRNLIQLIRKLYL